MEFIDAAGRRRRPSPRAVRDTLELMGAETAAPVPAPIHFVRPGGAVPQGAHRLELEGGGEVILPARRLPTSLPYGYHLAELADGSTATVVCSPGVCARAPARAWGWSAQLHALRSQRSWGMGDLGDLRRLARWSAELGAEVILVNPLHAPLPVSPQQPSPYFPSSRRFRNPLYIDIAQVPGARGDALVASLAERAVALNRAPLLDRDAVFAVKMRALEHLWGRFSADAGAGHRRAFVRYCAEQGAALGDFAVFCVLAEKHGAGWRGWPPSYRRPNSPAVARLAAAGAPRVDFHRWLQWLLDEQLARAGREIGIISDLAVGADPDGADAWAWQDTLATGAQQGVPPDAFNSAGQHWGFPPFDPHRLRAAAYRPLAEMLRATFRHSAGLRIDHVLGLFRQWWIAGAGSGEGVYVRYPAEELLEVVALESHRAGGFVVGEDLGLVGPGVRRALRRRGVLSCRVLWFEREPASRLPEMALATVSTHDLPTVLGMWDGSDTADQERAGLIPNRELSDAIRRRLGARLRLSPGAPPASVVEAVYRDLGQAPSRLLLAALEDACLEPRRPNMPGTINAWPNWSIPLPCTAEELQRAHLPRAIATALKREGDR